MVSEILDSPEEYTHSEIISRALKAWEEYDFKDQELWEAFKDNFEG